MGVMNCAVKNCENIMCDTYVPTIGYICDSCKVGFENKAYQMGVERTTPHEFMKLLGMFAEYGAVLPSAKVTVRTFFQHYTK